MFSLELHVPHGYHCQRDTLRAYVNARQIIGAHPLGSFDHPKGGATFVERFDGYISELAAARAANRVQRATGMHAGYCPTPRRSTR